MENVKFLLVVLMLAVMPVLSYADVLVYDDFNRGDNHFPGSTQAVMGATSYNWLEVEYSTYKVQVCPVPQAPDGALVTQYTSGGDSDGVALEGFTLADGKIGIDTTYIGGSQARINYRVQGENAEAVATDSLGYHFDPGDGTLYWAGWNVLGVSSIAINDGDRVEIAFEGNEHEVYVNDALALSYTETEAGRDVAGYIGFGARASNAYWDNLVVSAIPEPMSLSMLAVGALVSLRRRRK